MTSENLATLLEIQRKLTQLSSDLHYVDMTSGERTTAEDSHLQNACYFIRETRACLEKTLEKYRAK